MWTRHRWLGGSSTCGTQLLPVGVPAHSPKAPAAKCIQSSSNCNTWLPGSSLRQQLRLESLSHLLGWRSNCLACDLSQLLPYSGRSGAVQAESKPRSRTSWEFWCLHRSTTHCVARHARCSPRLGSLQCHQDCMEEARCPSLCDHQQNQGAICRVWDIHLS